MTRTVSRRPLAAALLAVALSATVASALPLGTSGAVGARATGGPDDIRLAQGGGCSSAAAQAAAQTGGQVLSVRTSQQGDRTVCVVTVLIPASDGNRPRRQTITIEQ